MGGNRVIGGLVLLIISDGGDNSSHSDLPAILRWAQNAKVAFYSVGLFDIADSDRNPRILKELAEATGGSHKILHTVI